MGNKQTTHERHDLLELQKQYREVQKEKNGVVLCHIDTNERYFMRQLSFINQKQFEKELQRLQQLMKRHENQNIIKVVKIWHKQFNTFCSNSFKIYAVYEYPQITLIDEIQARKKEGRFFEECDLWSILQSCANALADLKPSISIQPAKVYILPDGLLKLPHNDMIDDEYRCIIQDNVYYAPEKINIFHKPDKHNGLQKEAVFSMGMTLLHAALLEDLHSCYDYKNCMFIPQNLSKALKELQANYSEELVQSLSNILELNQNRRSSLIEIQDTLNSKWTNQDSMTPSVQPQKDSQMKVTQDNNGIQQNTKKDGHSNQDILPQHINTVNQVHPQQSCLDQYSNQPSYKENQFNDRITHEIRKNHEVRQSETPLNSTNTSYPYSNRLSYQPTYNSYVPTYQSKQNIFTDPKLLQMIRKDLMEISSLKNNVPLYDSTTYQPRHSFINISNLPPIIQSSNPVNIYVPPIITNQTYNTVTDAAGNTYQGMMVAGKKEGKGKLMYREGAYYDGEFKNDEMDGEGTLYYGQGRPAYSGEWKRDQFHGKGTIYNESPCVLDKQFQFQNLDGAENYWVKYEGEFKEDNKNGWGKLTLSNGETFQGLYLGDMANGPGQFHNLDGQVIKGEWQNNLLVHIHNE